MAPSRKILSPLRVGKKSPPQANFSLEVDGCQNGDMLLQMHISLSAQCVLPAAVVAPTINHATHGWYCTPLLSHTHHSFRIGLKLICSLSHRPTLVTKSIVFWRIWNLFHEKCISSSGFESRCSQFFFVWMLNLGIAYGAQVGLKLRLTNMYVFFLVIHSKIHVSENAQNSAPQQAKYNSFAHTLHRC